MPEPVAHENNDLPPVAGWKILIVILIGVTNAFLDLAITQESGQVWSYLWPIVPILVFTIGLGLKRRSLGYTFALSYGVTCGMWMIAGNLITGDTGNEAVFVGGAGLAMTISLFVLVWVIFWKLWRVVSSVKDTTGEVRPNELR